MAISAKATTCIPIRSSRWMRVGGGSLAGAQPGGGAPTCGGCSGGAPDGRRRVVSCSPESPAHGGRDATGGGGGNGAGGGTAAGTVTGPEGAIAPMVAVDAVIGGIADDEAPPFRANAVGDSVPCRRSPGMRISDGGAGRRAAAGAGASALRSSAWLVSVKSSS